MEEAPACAACLRVERRQQAFTVYFREIPW